MKAYEISNWLLEKNPTLYFGTYDGNVVLNKLLYFSNLMYYSIYNENLIEEKFEKWTNGPVIREIYTDYRYNNCSNIKKHSNAKISPKVKTVLNIVNFVYGDLSAKSLSDETHKHSIWKEQEQNGHLDFSRIEEKEKKLMNKIYSCYKHIDFDNLKFEIVNGTKYYYFKNKTVITEEVIKKLEENKTNEKCVFLEIYNGEIVFS